MVKYSCERCGKEFSQKSHYDSHNRRKTPCENNADKIKALVDKAVEEKSEPTISQSELDQIILISLEMFVVCFSITIFSNGIQRIFHGMQLGFLVHIMLTIGSIISLVLLYYFSTLKVEINMLVFASMIGNILASIPLLIILISKDLFSFRGVLLSINSQYKNIINLGGAFFLIQIGTIILIGADSLIISATIGVSGVAIFAITQRLFLFASQPMQLVNTHLWPAFADANNILFVVYQYHVLLLIEYRFLILIFYTLHLKISNKS